MKIYTRTGDRGDTSLFGGGRVSKNDPRVEAFGSVDELNACLGRAICLVSSTASRERLGQIQHDLFAIGAHLSSPPANSGRRRPELPSLPESRIPAMESWMDEADARLPPLRAFILPGGSRGASELHLCRTVCRRAERATVGIGAGESPGGDGGEESVVFAVRYLNRLSDLLFVLARLENVETGNEEVEWQKETGPS